MKKSRYYYPKPDNGALALLCVVLFLVMASMLGAVLYIFKFADDIPVFFVMEEGKEEWSEEKNLAIFQNGYNGDAVIYPGMSGSYEFRMRNDLGRELTYELGFSEVNDWDINLVYRLRLDGEYIAGGEDAYVSVEELRQKERTIAAEDDARYTLDWKWVDGDSDTLAGMEKATYTLKITFGAKIFNIF